LTTSRNASRINDLRIEMSPSLVFLYSSRSSSFALFNTFRFVLSSAINTPFRVGSRRESYLAAERLTLPRLVPFP
jgi:hypothetical protein